MPAPTDPPDPGLPQTVFDALHGMTYDSNQKAFSSGATKYFLFVDMPNGPGTCRWAYCTETEGGQNPKGLVPQVTYDVIHGGTFNVSTGTITYQSNTYRIRLKRDTANVQYAEAHVSA